MNSNGDGGDRGSTSALLGEQIYDFVRGLHEGGEST